MNGKFNCPIGKISVRGKINDRNDKDKQRMEILISDKHEIAKLPMDYYPLTGPPGLPVTLKSQVSICQATFHRYETGRRGGEHIYIGSATRRMKDRSQAKSFAQFLVNGGFFIPDLVVELDFVCNDQNIQIYIS